MHAAQAVHHACYSSHFITTQQILEHTQEMFCNLSCFCCTFSWPLTNPWQPAAVPVVFPGVNTGGVGSYVYDKEASAVTHPWTLLVPLSFVPLLYTTLTIDHSISRSISSPPHSCVRTWDHWPSSPDSLSSCFRPAPSRFSNTRNDFKRPSYVCTCSRRALCTTIRVPPNSCHVYKFVSANTFGVTTENYVGLKFQFCKLKTVWLNAGCLFLRGYMNNKSDSQVWKGAKSVFCKGHIYSFGCLTTFLMR